MLFQKNPLRVFTIVFLLLLYWLIYHSWLYFSGLLFHVTGTPPWFLRSVKVCTSSELYPNYFLLLSLASFFAFGVVAFHRQCYGFERTLFTLRCFLPCIPSPNLVHALPQPPFIKASLVAGSSSLKFGGFSLSLKTQTLTICLLEPHGVPQTYNQWRA